LVIVSVFQENGSSLPDAIVFNQSRTSIDVQTNDLNQTGSYSLSVTVQDQLTGLTNSDLRITVHIFCATSLAPTNPSSSLTYFIGDPSLEMNFS
jgi:hypothetical protein